MKTRKPTEVCFTIDTEFSIGGNFDNPLSSPVAEPIVLGAIDGKEHGLGFLLDSLAESGIRATFFVEALQTAYFGDKPMAAIAERIAEAGHDIQLHLHPCWLHYEAAAEGGPKRAPNDSCAARTDSELDHFFQSGLSAFSRWGLHRPIAVRPGNFQVDLNFYRAAARSGLTLSSSIALAVERPAEETLWLAGGRHRIGAMLEFPVLSFNSSLGRYNHLRALSITACSHSETLAVFRQARDLAISPIIVLTHPQEFIKRKDFRYATLRRNRVNQTRLQALLRFLKQNSNDFVVLPISELGGDEPNQGEVNNSASGIKVSFRKTVARIVENGINDRIWWY